jgi:hypothetical protein
MVFAPVSQLRAETGAAPDRFVTALEAHAAQLDAQVVAGRRTPDAIDLTVGNTWQLEYRDGVTLPVFGFQVPYRNARGDVTDVFSIGAVSDTEGVLTGEAGAFMEVALQKSGKATTFEIFGIDASGELARVATGLGLSTPTGTRVVSDPTAVEYAVMLALIIVVCLSTINILSRCGFSTTSCTVTHPTGCPSGQILNNSCSCVDSTTCK